MTDGANPQALYRQKNCSWRQIHSIHITLVLYHKANFIRKAKVRYKFCFETREKL